jgi:hypothetical protein
MQKFKHSWVAKEDSFLVDEIGKRSLEQKNTEGWRSGTLLLELGDGEGDAGWKHFMPREQHTMPRPSNEKV